MVLEITSDSKNQELVRFGNYFLGILNDLKRRPEDAAKELMEDLMPLWMKLFVQQKLGLSILGISI